MAVPKLLRLSEHYVSVQGEGPRTGMVTQFVRLAGCNLRCPGWPCDTEHAINPEIWRKESRMVTGCALYDEVFRNPGNNICLTGGEPLLQVGVHLQEFVGLCANDNRQIEVFTNGTQPIPDWLRRSAIFMMDWKLPGSGETSVRTFQKRADVFKQLDRRDGVKFVVTGIDDLVAARSVWRKLIDYQQTLPTFWVAPAWDRISPAEIVDYMKVWSLPWRLNIQVHKYIWAPEMQGV